MLGFSLSSTEPDSIAHIIQVALAPAFLLSALATLLNVFSTRLGRISDKVDALSAEAAQGQQATDAVARRLSRRLTFLRRRSFVLDIAVALASLGSCLIGLAVLTLFVGALRDGATASVLFACFGAALICTVAAIAAFMTEILMAGRGVRDEVDRQQDAVPEER
ncbi:DUF2721 domain-containing protein [Methylobacterium sp. J-030]|uniref:DUF2721 domain-containing protein n=1 Tax=Methylobacterium sp. J-030 TaxID=2836627 RepID=UPI001FBA8CE7|nr:DUF2721 domain-containing protein [Methylobacterium sp. J-030]MCJ2069279.1 DUF2721 domain-containing protein [Methylobacterium sp. J-030]